MVSIPLNKWVLSLYLPFTSWIFINEKMITTGLLTYLESMPLYVNVLLLPCLLLHFSNRESFTPKEKFFFLYVVGYMVLSVANQYIPLLGLLVKFTKGTGWHRSAPLFFFSGSVCIAIVASKLYSGKLGNPLNKFQNTLKKIYTLHRFLLGYMYAALFLGILGIIVAVQVFEWQGIYSILALATIRPKPHLEFILSHYLSFPRVIFISIVPLGIWGSLFAFERLRCCSGVGSSRKWIMVVLIGSVLSSQYALTKLYYPFNGGIDKVRSLSEVSFIKQLSPQDRLVIVKNPGQEIERLVIETEGLPENYSNPQLRILAADYPEFSRFQSNITMHGTFFSLLGPSVYTRGTNFINSRASRFHQTLIKNNPVLLERYQGGKAYLWIGLG